MGRNAANSFKRVPFVDPDSVTREDIFRRIGYAPDEWQARFHASPQKYRQLACGVRVGKTFAVTAEAVYAAVRPSPASVAANEWVGSRVWLVGPTYDLADRMFKPVLRHLKRYFPGWIVSASERDGIINTIGGGIIQRKSADNPDSLIGEELDAAILDEAARIGEEEMEMVRQRLLTRDGWLVCISSPTNVKWFRRMFELGQANGFHYAFEGDALAGARYAGRRVVFVKNEGTDDPDARSYFSIRVPTHANTRLKVEELALLERQTPERLFRQDYLAEFVGDTGAVFQNLDAALVPKQTGWLDNGVPGVPYVLGWDVARTSDYSVVSIADARSHQQVHFSRFRGSYESQYQRVMALGWRFNRPHVLIDATGKGDAPAERLAVMNREAGDPAHKAQYPKGPFARRIEPVEISSNAAKRALVESYQLAIEQGEYRLLDIPEQSQEHRLFEFRESKVTGTVRYGAPDGFNDDTVLANALVWRGLGRPAGSTRVFLG